MKKRKIKSKARKVSKKVSKKVEVMKVEPRKVPDFVGMDDDFETDWMVESMREKGDAWVSPDGHPRACEVRMFDGIVVAPCYFDGGVYVRIDGEKSIPVGSVAAVKYYVETPCEDSPDYSRTELREMLGDDGWRDEV